MQPNDLELAQALSYVNIESLQHLNLLGQRANNTVYTPGIDPLVAGAYCQQAADGWLNAAHVVSASNKNAGLILLKVNALHFLWLAAGYYHKAIINKKKFDLATYEDCLNLIIKACGLYYLTNNHEMIDRAMRRIGELNDRSKIDLGTDISGLLFLKLAKWSASLTNPASLTQSLYSLAAERLKSEFYNISIPSKEIVESYQEALYGVWGHVVILKEEINKRQDDLTDCLGLEKSIGDEIEQMSAKLLQLHSQGCSLPNIAYAGSKTLAAYQHPTLRRRRPQ